MNRPVQQHPWKVGEEKLESTRLDLHKLLRLNQLIGAAEEEHANLMAYSRSDMCIWVPDLRAESIQGAHVRIHQMVRLRRIFNSIAYELGF